MSIVTESASAALPQVQVYVPGVRPRLLRVAKVDAWHVEPFYIASKETLEVHRPASNSDHVAARLGDVDNVTGVTDAAE